MVTTILTFIVVFCVLVTIHELGHLIFAKRSGILVREFSIGMGPKLFAHRSKGTTYTIRLVPLGGYVRMAGAADEVDLELGMPISVALDENNKVVKINTSQKVVLPNSIPLEVTAFDLEKELSISGNVAGNENDPMTYQVDHDALIIESDGTEVQIAPLDVQFQSAKLSNRMLTNFAGPLFNFILSLVLFVFLGFAQGVPTTTPVIGSVTEDGVAAKAGFEAGDKILAINGKEVKSAEDVSKVIQSNADQEISITVARKDKEQEITVTPKGETQDGKEVGMIGISYGYTYTKDAGFVTKLKYGVNQFTSNALGIFKVLGSLITNFNVNKLGGPVMIYKLSAQAAESGIYTVIFLMAFLSVNLGIMNLLPIPAFDGGKLVLNVIEGVRGKPLSQEKEMIITMVGVVLIVILMVLVTWKDITTAL